MKEREQDMVGSGRPDDNRHIKRVVPSFHLLAKPTGASCNLGCRYCFFLEKDKMYPGSKFRMDDVLLENYIRQLIESHHVPEVTVAWQGGEPMLMGLEFFERSIELERKYARRGMRVQNTIQTNGTLIDDEWASFFKRNRFLVGLSIDGPRELHDSYRVDKAGRPTFDKVMNGLSHLREHDVEWNALTTINRINGDHPVEVYRFLRDECGAKFIQFIPIVERECVNGVPHGDVVTDRSVGPRQFGDFMIGVFDEWVRNDVASVYVQMFDVSLANWYGEPSGLCVLSPTCGTALAMEHNGDVFSCDHFVEPGYLLGNIQEQHLSKIASSDQQFRFGSNKRDLLPRYCLDCEVRFACHGGCPKDRFTFTPDGQSGLNYLCEGYRSFFKHIDGPMRMMCQLLIENKAPSEIMYMRS